MQLYEKALDLFEDDQSASVSFSLVIEISKSILLVVKWVNEAVSMIYRSFCTGIC